MERTPRVTAHSNKLPRTLHLIDIENLVSGAGTNVEMVKAALSAYQITRPQHGDTLVVGVAQCNHQTLQDMQQLPRKLGRKWRFNFTIVVGHNKKNGADQALLTALRFVRLPSLPLASTFDQVVFATGDGGFTPSAVDLQGEGVTIVHVLGMGDPHTNWRAHVHVEPIELGPDIYARFEESRSNRDAEGG